MGGSDVIRSIHATTPTSPAVVTPPTSVAKPVAAEKDYALLGTPTITITVFSDALVHHGSPAVVDYATKRISPHRAEALYAIILSYGVDPNVALSQFLHESSMGTAGAGAANLNWGNLREGPKQAESVGGFARYKSWYDGLDDYCWMIAEGGLYYPSIKTVSQMTARYAPAGDGNNPGAYADAVNLQCALWEALSEHKSAAPA